MNSQFSNEIRKCLLKRPFQQNTKCFWCDISDLGCPGTNGERKRKGKFCERENPFTHNFEKSPGWITVEIPDKFVISVKSIVIWYRKPLIVVELPHTRPLPFPKFLFLSLFASIRWDRDDPQKSYYKYGERVTLIISFYFGISSTFSFSSHWTLSVRVEWMDLHERMKGFGMKFENLLEIYRGFGYTAY